MPERSQPGDYIPHLSVHRLRERAARGDGALLAQQVEVQRLFDTEAEGTPPPPHIVDVEDVTRGLGIPDEQRATIERMISGTPADFTVRGGTQRVVSARGALVELLRSMRPHIPSDARQEMARRALTFWKKRAPIDSGRSPQMRYVVQKVTLEKGEARGGKYYRRVPTGNPKRPWRYYYTREEYERDHGDHGHLHGPEVKQRQLGLDFSEAPPKPEKKPEVEHAPEWMQRRRTEAVAAIESGDARKVKVRLDGAEGVHNALEGPGAERGKAWLREHVIRPLSDAWGRLVNRDAPVPEAAPAAAARARVEEKRAARRAAAEAQPAPPPPPEQPAPEQPASAAIARIAHLSDAAAAQHLEITLDLSYNDAIAAVARHRYGLDVHAWREAKSKGTLPPRLDAVTRQTAAVPAAKLAEPPEQPIVVREAHPKPGFQIPPAPKTEAEFRAEHEAETGQPFTTEAEAQAEHEAQQEVERAAAVGEPDEATRAQFKESTDRKGMPFYESPDGIYRIYALKGRNGNIVWDLLTKQTWNGQTSWESARNGFTGTKAAAMETVLRREEAIRRRDAVVQANVERYNAEQSGETTSGPSGPSGASEHTIVGGDTYVHRNTIKAHGGRWDSPTKTWKVPTANVEKLKAALSTGHVHDVEAGELTLGRDIATRETAAVPMEKLDEAPGEVEAAPVLDLASSPPGWKRESGTSYALATLVGEAHLTRNALGWSVSLDGETIQLPKHADFSHAEGVVKQIVEKRSAPAPTPPQTTSTWVDSRGRAVQVDTSVPPDGRVETSTDADGSVTTRTYDAQGALRGTETKFSDASREQLREQATAARNEREARQRKHLNLDFTPGETLFVNGKKYTIGPTVERHNGRSVSLFPAEGRAVKLRELYIYPGGMAGIRAFGSSQQGEVKTLEGGKPRETPWTPPPKKPPPEPPRPTPEPPRPPPMPTTSEDPKGSPRAEATKATKKAEEEGEYINDRSSSIEQRGEDVLGSARHRAFVWKTLRDALSSSDAGSMFTRDFLAKQEPIDLIARVQRVQAESENIGKVGNTALAALIAHYAMRKFGPKPEMVELSQVGGKITYYYDGDKLTRVFNSAYETPTQEEHVRRQRESYYHAYTSAKGVLERFVDGGDADVNAVKLSQQIRQIYETHRDHYGIADAGTEALRTLYNGVIGRGKTSARGQANEFVGRLSKKYPEKEDQLRKVPEHVMRVLEGYSMNEAFGTKQSKDKGIDLSELYDTKVMRRTGPASQYQSAKQGLDLLDKHAGGAFEMRGVQWGKSVTDDEREHHLKSLVDSCADLTDVLGLPPKMASFNGKLAIAVGARGKGTFAAHYEPGQRVINLTRANGAGTLAHEWGHMFDNLVMAAAGEDTITTEGYKSDARYSSEIFARRLRNPTPTEEPTFQAMNALQSSDAMVNFRRRLHGVIQELKERGLPHGEEYWASGREVFARCFEVYVQRKLQTNGRENTYLTSFRGSGPGSELWPSTAEVDAMTPHFDKLFEAFRGSSLLHKAIAYMSERPKDLRSKMYGGDPIMEPRRSSRPTDHWR